MHRIFVSSVQRELAAERRAVRDFVHNDPLLRRFFTVFLFEDLPAQDHSADEVYLGEVDQCAIYVGIFGSEYGAVDPEGVSPTEHEFVRATERARERLIFVKGDSSTARHQKMTALIDRAAAEVVRRRFASIPELTAELYAALVQYLEDHELIRTGPFDASACAGATVADLDPDRIATFLARARAARGFPLPAEATAVEVLTHLNLLHDEQPTNAAVLLFSRQPQRFLISSEIRCAHLHGTTLVKPIPSYQVYKGTVFELVDQAVDFVMSKLNLAVGTRAESTAAPVAYEMPLDMVREAIVNAVAHRDYASNASVQVMLYADRLEVRNPGALPPSLTLEMLRRAHPSVPANPLLAEPMYLVKYIERMGTGTGEMIALAEAAGLPTPRFSLDGGFLVTLDRRPKRALEAVQRPEEGTKSAPSRHQVEILRKSLSAQPLTALMEVLGRSDRTKFRHQVLAPLLAEGLIEPTVPEKPRSRLQRYLTTTKGRSLLAALDRSQGHE
jgi:ATP-dependent DNA helicase RecG